MLEGGIEGRPDNVIFYATSNRRHLLPRDMIENERSTAINPAEAVEEKVSLSDRFGLWLGFHKCSQDDYLDMVRGYVAFYGLGDPEEDWRPRGPGMGNHPRQPVRTRCLSSSFRIVAGRLGKTRGLTRSPAQGRASTFRKMSGSALRQMVQRIDRLVALAQFEMHLRLVH